MRRRRGLAGPKGSRNGRYRRRERIAGTKRSREPKYIQKFKSSIRNNGQRDDVYTSIGRGRPKGERRGRGGR